MNVNQTLMITIGISAVLVAVGIITADTGIVGNAIILSAFIISSPILFVRYKKFREFKEMEEKFPVFLRDLIESLRAGLPLHKAILSANKISYGSLSNEVKKMSSQISWNMPVDKVLGQFADRVKSSKKLNSGVQVIRESYLSGGNVVSTMDSIATSHIALLDAEKERSSALGQYVIVMYAISLIVIAIVVGINKIMVPIFSLSQQSGFAESGFAISNPCNACTGIECGVCAGYDLTAHVFKIDPQSPSAYYTSLFFFMSIIQSIFSGLVAGQISEGSLVAGFRHSLILASITFGTFSILVRVGLLGA